MATKARIRAEFRVARGVMIGCILFAAQAVSVRAQGNREPHSIQEQVRLAADYLVGRGVERDASRAAYWYQKAANFGDPGAQRALAQMYLAGLGVGRDPVQAARWLERAVAGGSVEAKVDLATSFLWGTGVKKDPQLSARWFEEAAHKGSGRAATYLGDMYHFGIGMPIDDAGARRWYEVGAKRNDSLAQYRLGLLLLQDRSDRRIAARAAELFRKASDAGLVPAKYALGVLLSEKPELASSAQEGESSIEGAANAGMWKASVVLGVHAFNGTPNQRNPGRAYFWFQVASLQGGAVTAPLVRRYMDALSTELGARKTQEIELAAERWFEEHKTAIRYAVGTSPGSEDAVLMVASRPGETREDGMLMQPKGSVSGPPY
jgi:TPR repeat protein